MGSGSSKSSKSKAQTPKPSQQDKNLKSGQQVPQNSVKSSEDKKSVTSSEAEQSVKFSEDKQSVKSSQEDRSVQSSQAETSEKSDQGEMGEKANQQEKNQGSVVPTEMKSWDRWQDADLSYLLGDLKITDDSNVWAEHVDKLIAKFDSKIVPERKRKGWKTVRLFVSSTFKDMASERDFLVKKVFPTLRQWCEERKLRLVECDLRWGVPKDADSRETLLTCLSEIERCKEENIFPYFLNLMSERYGWVPKPNEVPDDIRVRYKWIPGMSVTTLEICTGAYWDRNPHALYMMRKPGYLENIKDEKVKSIYMEKRKENQTSLETLKGKLREKYPQQVFDYDCCVEKVEDGKAYLTDLDQMGETVLSHLKIMLEQQYPTDSLGSEPSLIEALKFEHETFMMQRSQVLLGRDEDVASVLKYISEPLQRNVPLVLVGFPGAGKSALASYTIKQSLQEPKYKVFYHFVGATPRSTDLFQILSRFFLEFMPSGEKMPEDVEEMKRFSRTMFKNACERVIAEGYERFVIFIDALNQMDDDGNAHYLGWLPQDLPVGMRLIVSTLEGKCLNSLRDRKDERKPFEQVVEPLGIPIREKIVTKILQEYSKKLHPDEMSILVKKADAGRPLWLTVACEELRVFGEFRKLTQKIKDMPEDMIGLLELVLRRIVTEFGEDLVVATLCLVETSKFGLLETELMELLAIQPIVPGKSSSPDFSVDGKLTMAKWALVYLGLRQFLRPCGDAGEGRLDFHHRTISKVVKKMYLEKEKDRIWWHKRLAQYFQNCSDIERKAEELPYHLEMSEDKEALKKTLLTQDMFNQMYMENNKQQLMKYWRVIGGYQVASAAYVTALKVYLREQGLTDIDEIEPIQTKTAWFLIDIGEYDEAKKLLEEVIRKVSEKYGKDDVHMGDALHAMLFLLYRKALQFVYGAHPGYKECMTSGRSYCDTCAYIFQKNYPKTDRTRGHVLTLCGYFKAEYLDEAKAIFEKIDDKQGLGQILYMLGEKNQYHQDMNVPIQLFTQSNSLCMSTFGKYHLHTARSYQLFGQLYWNSYVYNHDRTDWLETCLTLYKEELEILEEILGPEHVTTVRSREDVIIILDTLGRSDETKPYRGKQPKQHQAL